MIAGPIIALQHDTTSRMIIVVVGLVFLGIAVVLSKRGSIMEASAVPEAIPLPKDTKEPVAPVSRV